MADRMWPVGHSLETPDLRDQIEETELCASASTFKVITLFQGNRGLLG